MTENVNSNIGNFSFSDLSIKKLVVDSVTLTGSTYYEMLLPPPPDSTPFLVKLYLSPWYGKYFQYPVYNPEKAQESRRFLFLYQNIFGLILEICMFFLRLLQIVVFFFVTLLVGTAFVQGILQNLYLLMLLFLIPLTFDLFANLVVSVVRVVVFIITKPKGLSFMDYIRSYSMFTPPSKLQQGIHSFTKNLFIRHFGFDIWCWFHLFRGSGYTFYWHRFINATGTLLVSIDYMESNVPGRSFNGAYAPFGLMFIYGPDMLFTLLHMVHTRILYYFQKEVEYISMIDDLTEKINKGGKKSDIKSYQQDRDRYANRLFKQKKKWLMNFPIVTLILGLTWGLFSNANLIMSGGKEAIDYINLIFNYITEIILGVLLMGYAMKMPFLTRFFQRVIESVPKNTRGYLLIRFLHSNYVRELPNVFLLFFGTISNLIGLIAGFLELGKIFDGENWWRGLFFWLPLWFGIFGQVFASIAMLIYPFIFCGFMGISFFKKNDPDDDIIPPADSKPTKDQKEMEQVVVDENSKAEQVGIEENSKGEQEVPEITSQVEQVVVDENSKDEQEVPEETSQVEQDPTTETKEQSE